jgi:hypothetical protein
MKRGECESLDEAIDRVAAALTGVPSDASPTVRLKESMAERPSATPFVWACSVLAVAAVALLIASQMEEPQTEGVARMPTVLPSTQFVSTMGERLRTGIAELRPVMASSGRNEEVEGAVPFEPVIGALMQPNVLTVEALAVDPLNIVPAAVDELTLEALTVSEIGNMPTSKEQF